MVMEIAMDFQDPVIKAEVEAILTTKDIWSRCNKFEIAMFALRVNLFKRGYSLEEISQATMYIYSKQSEMLKAYYLETYGTADMYEL